MDWDDYRVEREWRRYEGSPLRDLYRQLRERFLERHRPTTVGLSLEVGPGPGRFTDRIGHPNDRVSLLELSRATLTRFRSESRPGSPSADLIQGDAVEPPFREGKFQRVVLLGNVLGFAEGDYATLLAASGNLVRPSGKLLVEFVAGPGERSHYLHRLPSGAIARLLAAPLRAIQPRVDREGFDRIREREGHRRRFRRISATEITRRLESARFVVRETLAVAPCLGNDPARLAAVHASPTAWARLLDLEESVGRAPARLTAAAAILLAAERANSDPVARQSA
jgi:SAM-dependent methyltransferase